LNYFNFNNKKFVSFYQASLSSIQFFTPSIDSQNVSELLDSIEKETKFENLIRHCKQWALAQISGETKAD